MARQKLFLLKDSHSKEDREFREDACDSGISEGRTDFRDDSVIELEVSVIGETY